MDDERRDIARTFAIVVALIVVVGAGLGLVLALAGGIALHGTGLAGEGRKLDTSERATIPVVRPKPPAKHRLPPTGPNTTTLGPTPSGQHQHHHHRRHPITLQASPRSVSSMERINLTGSYPKAAAGTVLQVQQRLGGGGWEAFPVTVTVQSGGHFATWVETGLTGKNWFRVADTGSGKASRAVLVHVG